MPLFSWLARMVTAASVAWFALLACAPMSTTPVPGMMGDNTNSFELMGSTTAGEYLSSSYGPSNFGWSGQLSYVHRFPKPGLHVGGVVFGGQANLVGAGAIFGGMYKVGPTQMGFQIAGGWLWGEVAMPISLPLGKVVWVYTMPSVGARSYIFRVPVGVGFHLGEHVSLSLEGAGLVQAPISGAAVGATLSTGIGFQF